MISVVQLGLLDYATALRLQQTLVDLRKSNQVGDVLLLLEHTPVITLGRNAKRSNVLASDAELASRGVELFECDRGGDVTFHGPGQLVGYPIFDLRTFPISDGGRATSPGPPSTGRKSLGAIDYVRRLEEVLIRTCADFGVAATRVPGLTGVWTQPSTSVILSGAGPASSAGPAESKDPYPAQKPQAKLAAIGVHISRSVTSHGFALNVTNEPLDFFNLIIPCGLTSKPVTSLEKEISTPVILSGAGPARSAGPAESKDPYSDPAFSLDSVSHSLTRNFGRVFNRQILWVDSLDALLGHRLGIPLKVPAEIRRLRGDEDIFRA